MQITANVVMTGLMKGIGKKSGNPYYQFRGVIVGCQSFDALVGVDFNKFISEDVYNELLLVYESGCDRFDCSIGVSRTSVGGKDCDIGFNLYINGLPKEPEEEIVADGQAQASAPAEDKGTWTPGGGEQDDSVPTENPPVSPAEDKKAGNEEKTKGKK